MLPFFRYFLPAIIVFHTLAIAGSPEEAASAVRNLLTASSVTELRQAQTKAQTLGVSVQALAEANLLFGIRTEDTKFLRSVLRELDTAAIAFEPLDSISGLASVEQFRGLLCYARALMAIEDEDEDEFRIQIEKGFWLFPEQGSLFGKAAARRQTQQRMAYLTVDFSTILLDAAGKETTLGTLLGGGRGVLLYFWSGTAKNGIAGLEDLLPLAPRLTVGGIVLAGVNTEGKNPDISAREFQKTNDVSIPWLAEPDTRGLARLMEIGAVPRVVLVSDRGRILFNGNLRDPALWKAVRQLVPTFTTPMMK